MASRGPEGAFGGCSGSSPSSGQGARPVGAPPEPPGSRSGSGSGSRSGSGLPRNVLSERERRKRISVSCERLRALLPRFDGRREDMASVLEMAVQFLRLAGTLVPSQEPRAVLGLSKETWREWQRDVTQQAMSRSSAAGPPDCGTGACGLTVPRAPSSCVTAGAGEGEAPLGVAEVPEGPPALPAAGGGPLLACPGFLFSAREQGPGFCSPRTGPQSSFTLGLWGPPGPVLVPAAGHCCARLLSGRHAARASRCPPDPSVIEALQPAVPALRPKSLQGAEAAPTLASPFVAATLPPGERRGSELPGPGWAPSGGGRPCRDTGHQARVGM
ncbi:spermatogenesis- and oogenesis-specific basic helix-loop-helix-containing protein 1 isoform X2 [Eumetopias jubatus]|uniref:spermatogenesis- and oogenesis-specific basic helix-loop-helix-containing protein 1 isoform X2 n=1 Tax=Eumetopias jubatus TaxID=34886 RepID=UPI001015FC06|nr:spermatogenesis- and oogenesis-specific basic helix-loop-helix-containing protein 1 isoform X2 [Eumetopias jubatus]